METINETEPFPEFRAGSPVEAPPAPDSYEHRLTPNIFENFFIVGAPEHDIFNLIIDKAEAFPRVLASFKGTTTDAGISRLYFPLGYEVQMLSKRPTFFSTIKTDQMGNRTYHHVLIVYERVDLDLCRAPSLVSMPSWNRERLQSNSHLSPSSRPNARHMSMDFLDNLEFTSSQDEEKEDEDEDDPLLSNQGSYYFQENKGDSPRSPTIKITTSPPLIRDQSRKSEESKALTGQSKQTVFAPLAIAIETKSRNFEAFRRLLVDYIYTELVAYEKPRAKRFFLAYEKLVLLNTLTLPPPNTIYEIQFRTKGEVLQFEEHTQDFFWCSGVPLRILFRQLSVKQVLLVFRAVLLNFHVVFLSSKLNLLFYASEAIEQLMLPLKLSAPAVYIPITMDPTMISAPFPFVIGLHTDLLEEAPDNPDALFVHLDNGLTVYGKPTPSSRQEEAERRIPNLPEVDRMALQFKLKELLRPENSDIDFPFPQYLNARNNMPVMSDAYFAAEVRKIMMGFMLKYLSHFELNKEDFRPGGDAASPTPNFKNLKNRLLHKFNKAPDCQQFAAQLVETTGFQLWSQQYIERREFESRYMIKPIAPREISSRLTPYKPGAPFMEKKLKIKISMPQDPYCLLNLLESVVGVDDQKGDDGGSFVEGLSLYGSMAGPLPKSLQGSMQAGQYLDTQQTSFIRKRTDLGLTGDCKTLSKCIIKKIKEILSKEAQLQMQSLESLLDNNQRSKSDKQGSESSDQLPRIIQLHSIGNRISVLSTRDSAKTDRIMRAFSETEQCLSRRSLRDELIAPQLSQNSHLMITQPSALHPLSPKKGMELPMVHTATIEEQPRRFKRAYREAQRLAHMPIEDGSYRAHPYNNVVSFFFGRKGLINFLNIIRRSLRQKNYNSLSFKEALLNQLVAIRHKYFNSQEVQSVFNDQESTTLGSEDFHSGSMSIASARNISEYLESLPQSMNDGKQRKPGHVRGQSLEINFTGAAQQGELEQVAVQEMERQRLERLSSQRARQDGVSTRSEHGESSGDQFELENKLISFEFPVRTVYHEFSQFHYFCASHYERFQKGVLAVLDCYIEAGKISDVGLPGGAIEKYINAEPKERVQRLHCNFFKEVIKTRPLVSRIISKVKQNKSKELIRGKITHLKESGRTPSQRPSVIEFNSDRRIRNITVSGWLVQNWNYMPKPTSHKCDQCKDAAERPIDESLSISIHALIELKKWMKETETGKYKKSSELNVYGGKAAHELKKILEKYFKLYEQLESFPTSSEPLAMFLLNTFNFLILGRTLEECGRDKRQRGAYVWYKFLSDCEIQMGEVRITALEILHCCLRFNSFYQPPFVNQCFKWPKQFSNWESGKTRLRVDIYEQDLSMGIHFPLRNMPEHHIFTLRSPLHVQLAQIKSNYINAQLEVCYNEINGKVTVKLPQYFEWFILDFVGAQDLVERNMALLVHISQVMRKNEDLKFSLLRSYIASDQEISVRFVDVAWELPRLISNTC